MKGHLFTSALFIVLLGCGSAEDETNVSIEDLSQNPSSRIVTSTISAGEQGCESGGVKIDMGFDKNDNSILDSDEIADSYIVCNGSTGGDGLTSLIKLYDEEQGSNCSNGGKRIVTGVDLNSDNLLSSNEVQDTQYLCNSESIADAGCSVEENLDGSATISCGDGTSATVGETNGKVLYIIACYGQLTGVFSDIYWEYEAFAMDNEDVMIRAGISDAELEVNRSIIYSSKDFDYESAPVTIWYDVYSSMNYGSWVLSFDQVNSGVNVEYEDSDLFDGVRSWPADINDCNFIDYRD